MGWKQHWKKKIPVITQISRLYNFPCFAQEIFPLFTGFHILSLFDDYGPWLKYRLPGRKTSGIREGFDYCHLYLDPIDIWNPQSMSISISFFYHGKTLVRWQREAHLHPGLRPVTIFTFSINLFTNHALSNHKLDS